MDNPQTARRKLDSARDNAQLAREFLRDAIDSLDVVPESLIGLSPLLESVDSRLENAVAEIETKHPHAAPMCG